MIYFNSEDSPVEFSVDISSAEFIKIEGSGGLYVSSAEFIKIEGSGGLYVDGDWVPGICVSGLCLY